jgi:hypothetical protein
LVGGLLKEHMPIVLGMMLGGAVGGLLAYVLSEGLVRLIAMLWPPKTIVATNIDEAV